VPAQFGVLPPQGFAGGTVAKTMEDAKLFTMLAIDEASLVVRQPPFDSAFAKAASSFMVAFASHPLSTGELVFVASTRHLPMEAASLNAAFCFATAPYGAGTDASGNVYVADSGN